MHESAVALGRAAVAFKTSLDNRVETVPWTEAGRVIERPLAPWRTFRWWYGQQHYSGIYWSATMRRHVIYESRLELSRLIYADFDPKVTYLDSQPFLIEAEVDGKRRRHIPDFLLRTSGRPIVVDVKPLARTTDEKVAYTLEWTRQLVASLDWEYEVWTEPPPVELANLRFLAGYRNDRYLDRRVVEALRSSRLHGLTVGEAIAGHASWPAPLVRAAVCHLLWHRRVHTDLTVALQSTSLLWEDAE